MVKKINLEEEFPQKISGEEKVYRSIVKGNKTYTAISEDIRIDGGGGVTAPIKRLLVRNLIKKRKCSDCGLHDVFEVVK